ncbi:MAG: GNAT family N-acetyltransferase [Oscillospiraceae bacterium]|nr:GNAT family N-acetyltransferase [Oscillospiraceae bacterium]
MDIKFTTACSEDIDTIYCNAISVYEMFQPYMLFFEDFRFSIYNDIRNHLSDCHVVKYRGKKVAYYCLGELDGSIELRYLYVEEQHRFRGIATAIVRRCVSDTERPINAKVHFANYEVQSLLRHNGFVQTESSQDHIYNYVYKNDGTDRSCYADLMILSI